MDELNEKLSGILNDPESMARVRKMAESILGDSDEPQGDTNGIDADTLAKVTGILSRLKTSGNDNRTALLLALKPNLSEHRQKRVDTAVKLLRLIELLPYLKESGILDNI